MSKVPDLIRRQRALDKTQRRYRDKALDWKRIDCGRMLRTHLLAMGHRNLPVIPSYSTAMGAKRALKKMGFDTMEQLMDSLLPRITPAAALPGDIILVPGSEGLASVTISLGAKAFGWHEDAPGATTLIHKQVIGAWRG